MVSYLDNDDDIMTVYNEDFKEASLNAIYTIHENYNTIIQTIALHELNTLEDNGVETIYTEASVEGFVLAIKKFLLQIWRAIAGMFKSFTQMLDRYIKNDKEFINKYKEKFLHNKLDSDFSFSGYIYTINDQKINNAINKLHEDPILHSPQASNIENYGKGNIKGLDARRADLDKDIEILRAAVVNILRNKPIANTARLSQSDMQKEIAAALRNDSEDKEELTISNIDTNDIIVELTNYRKTRKTARDAFKAGKRVIDDAIKEAESRYKDVQNTPETQEKDTTGQKRDNKTFHNDRMRELSYYLTWNRNTKTILTAIEASVLGALKERSRQYKAMVIKIINYKPTKESFSEGALWEYHDNDTYKFISDIELK